jgi:hypothetical protein
VHRGLDYPGWSCDPVDTLNGPYGKSDRGGALIEFVITLPLLLVLIAGLTNIGAVQQQIVVFSDAARQGARYGAARSHATGLSCAQLLIEAENEARRYIDDSGVNRHKWWGEPVAELIIREWRGFSRTFVRVVVRTKPTQCLFCVNTVASALQISARSEFMIEGACS